MSFGIIEVISLLLGMSGFGLQANPKAPSADQSLEYAMPDADVVGYFDAASVIPGNYKVLAQLADQPQIKASPDLQKLVRQAVAEVDGPRGLVKSMTGIDVTTDIADLTACFQIVPNHDPNMVIAVHGKFKAETIDKLAKLSGKTSIKTGATSFFDNGDGSAVGLTKDGVLIAGTTSLIKDRLADAWKPPAHAAGTNLGYSAEVLAGKPVLAFVFGLSQAARTEALAKLTGPNFGTDLIKRHKVASFALYHDGIGWSWIDSTKPGLDEMAQVSDGLVDVLRASQIAPRGFAKIVLGALESYRGDKRVEEILRHKADIMKIVDSYIGDGTFKAKVDNDPKALKLTVRLTGKTASDVVPFGVIVPLAAVGMMAGRRAAAEPSVMPVNPAPMKIPAPAPPPPAPKKK